MNPVNSSESCLCTDGGLSQHDQAGTPPKNEDEQIHGERQLDRFETDEQATQVIIVQDKGQRRRERNTNLTDKIDKQRQPPRKINAALLTRTH